MRWINHSEAQVLAFSTPDAQPIAFRLPGHLTQDRVHLLGRAVFGYRANVERGNGTWVVQRIPFLDARARERLQKMNRRNTQRNTDRTSRQTPQLVLRWAVAPFTTGSLPDIALDRTAPIQGDFVSGQ